MRSIVIYKKFNINMFGIYQIRNIKNDKIYIGATSVSFSSRKTSHFSLLKKNKHYSQHLQKSYNKYGKDNFIFEILQICNSHNVMISEQIWLDKLKSYLPKNGYNLLKVAGSCKGRKLSKEHKKKISESEKGKYVSLETRNKISKALKGRPNSKKGQPRSKQTKKKIGDANRGHICSNTTRLKISKKLMGRKVSQKTIQSLIKRCSKKVIAIDFFGNIIHTFSSARQAQRILGFTNQGISRSCLTGGKYKEFYWKHIN